MTCEGIRDRHWFPLNVCHTVGMAVPGLPSAEGGNGVLDELTKLMQERTGGEGAIEVWTA